MEKAKLVDLLKKIMLEEKQLSVKWDTGGDQTIVNFEIDGKPNPYNNDMLYDDLRAFLIEKFELPNAGEYYNNGDGIIDLDEDGEVIIEYNECAYYEDSWSDVDTNNLEKEIQLEDKTNVSALLKEFELKEISFYGSIQCTTTHF